MTVGLKRIVVGGFRLVGLHIQRWHDPYKDAAGFVGIAARHVVDGGAHRGTIISRLLTQFPAATVHAFEPQEEPFRQLREQFGTHPRVRLNPQALADHEGTAPFYINKDCYSSLLPTRWPDQMEATGTHHDVAVTTLDAWSESTGIIPDFVKLDLQGSELAALRGARRLLENGVRAVLTEVNFVARYQGSCLCHEVAQWLYDHGFSLFRLYDIWGGPARNWQQGDALFVRNEFLGV